jgi:phosphoribosylanthranilate isomerase
MRLQIAHGRAARRERIRELTAQLGIHRNTVHRVYLELQASGLLVSRPGKGVFVNETAAEMNRIARLCRLDRLQLHGEEPHGLLAALERPAFRAFRPRSDADAAALDAEPDGTLLLDTFHEGLYGGTGRSFNWAWAARMARRRRIILAGGLTAENVGAAVAAVHPYGLDVSSSMESAPGIKDAARISAFFQALADLPGATPPQGATHASAT